MNKLDARVGTWTGPGRQPGFEDENQRDFYYAIPWMR
jgi:hypothetical protein